MTTQLRMVSTSEQFLWNGVVVSPGGHMFAIMPGWMGPTPGVVEIASDGSWTPFPNSDWNRWDGLGDPTKHFVDVSSIFSDGLGSLWVLDAAAPYFGDAIEGAVKLIELDIATGNTLRTIIFKRSDAPKGTLMAHIRFWGNYAVMTESREGSFNVIDLRDNSYKRILAGHNLLCCQPEDVPVIEGLKIHLLNGQPMYIHNDLLEIPQDDKTMLFMCLFGARIFLIDLELITDFSKSEGEIVEGISVYRDTGTWIAGRCRDAAGNIYLCDAENNGISVMSVEGEINLLVKRMV